MPIMTPDQRARKASEDLRTLGERIAEARRQRDAANSLVVKLEAEHLELVRSLLVDQPPDSPINGDVPARAEALELARTRLARARETTASSEPLIARVVKCLGAGTERMSPDEIARAINEDVTRVTYCLRDIRSKRHMAEKPVDGRWTLNAKGRAYYEALIGEQKEAGM